MASLEEKVKLLGLQLIDTNPLMIAEVYQIYLINSSKTFKYYKMYGTEHMFYSIQYLENTSVEQLLIKDQYYKSKLL